MTNIDQVLAALSKLSPEDRRQVVDRLGAEAITELAAAAEEKAKKTRISRISAMRAERDPEFRIIEGALSRAGIKIEDVVDTLTLDKLFASAIRPIDAENRMVIKAGLHRLRLIA